jgi:putative N6-adenine-specific DNA methylase
VPLLDPCCGAGTIAIEAAQIACGIAPGLSRRFAFERLAPWRAHLPAWRAMQRRPRATACMQRGADLRRRRELPHDRLRARNAERAGVATRSSSRPPTRCSAAPAPHGTMMLNPPYGERIEAKGQGRPGAAREGFEGDGKFGGVLRRAGGALEAPLCRLDGLGA